MAPVFGPDTPVVAPERVDFIGLHKWLLWPALQYRVVSPLIHEQHLDAFQRALLGASRAGKRDVGEIADLLCLETDLVELVRTSLRDLGYLDQHGTVTAKGEAALADGFLDPARTIVTYVYQDPFTGTVWPASVPRLNAVVASWEGRSRVRVQFGSAGEPLLRLALPVPPPDRAVPDLPTAEEVVEAVARGEAARRRAQRQAGREDRRWDAALPQRIVSRVAMVGAGEPVYLPVALLLLGQRGHSGDGDGERASTWLAFSPFTGRSSAFLRQLVAARCEHHPPLRELVDKLLGRSSDALFAEYDELTTRVRREITERLETRFTLRIREHRELLERLTVLEDSLRKAVAGERRGSDLGHAILSAWQVHEIVLRHVLRRRPWKHTNGQPFTHTLGLACQEIGLDYGQAHHVRLVSPTDVESAFRNPVKTRAPTLIAAAVLSASQGGADHPVRRMARRRPDLVAALLRLSADRNDPTHAEPVELSADLVTQARELAHDAVSAFLGIQDQHLDEEGAPKNV